MSNGSPQAHVIMTFGTLSWVKSSTTTVESCPFYVHDWQKIFVECMDSGKGIHPPLWPAGHINDVRLKLNSNSESLHDFHFKFQFIFIHGVVWYVPLESDPTCHAQISLIATGHARLSSMTVQAEKHRCQPPTNCNVNKIGFVLCHSHIEFRLRLSSGLSVWQ